MRHSYVDEYATLISPMHRLDPRVKIIAFITFILFIIFTKPGSFVVFALYGLLIGLMIFFSRIPLKFVLRRSLVVAPFVLMVSVFIPFVLPGWQGWIFLVSILIKSYLSILCIIVITGTTKFTQLLKALEKMRCPQLITMILSFMYRYIFVLEDQFQKMKQAKDSRSVGGSKAFHVRAVANMMGVLFIRGYERAESVYLAMCARGFQGSINTLDELRVRPSDICFLVIILAALIVIRAFVKL